MSSVQVFRKHCGEKEKLLVTSNFSFSHSVFYLFGELSAIFIKFDIVVCNLFQFGRVLYLSFGNRLRLLQMNRTNLYLSLKSKCVIEMHVPCAILPYYINPPNYKGRDLWQNKGYYGKSRNNGTQHFHILLIYFLLSRTSTPPSGPFQLSSAKAFNLDQYKIL